MTITLSKTRKADGKPNPYRTRWVEIDGATFEVASDSLDGLWMIALDLDLAHRTQERNVVDSRERRRLQEATLAWVQGDLYVSAIAFTLAEAREKIAEIVASPEWPAQRDAYLALLPEAPEWMRR